MPEGVRILLASFFMLMVAVFLFNNWTASVSSGLGPTIVFESAGGKKPQPDTKDRLEIEGEKLSSAYLVSSPLASVADFFKSWTELFKPSLPADGLKNNLGIKESFAYLTSNIYGFLGKTWNYIYEPLR